MPRLGFEPASPMYGRPKIVSVLICISGEVTEVTVTEICRLVILYFLAFKDDEQRKVLKYTGCNVELTAFKQFCESTKHMLLGKRQSQTH